MPAISIIVPVYNVETYLPQCLDSLRTQSFNDIEVICVIDGSKDRSEHIATLYSRVDKRIKVVLKENGGLSSARNEGVNHASGDIIMFVDSDDLLEKAACQSVYDAFMVRKCDIVTFGGKAYPGFNSNPWLDTVLSPRDVFYDSFSPDILFKESSRPYVWRTAISQQFWNNSNVRFDESLAFGEDQVFHFAIYPRAQRTQFLSAKLYLYRVNRRDSLMHTRETNLGQKFSDHLKIVDHICADWKNANYFDKYSCELLEWTIDFLLYDATKLHLEHQQDAERSLVKLWKKWFCEKDFIGINLPPNTKVVVEALINENAVEPIWNNYAKSMGLLTRPTRTSLIYNKLQRLLPASAEGLQERLENAQTENRWYIEDSSACTRSLLLLQAELLANNKDTINL